MEGEIDRETEQENEREYCQTRELEREGAARHPGNRHLPAIVTYRMLSILIPTYQEREAIGELLQRLAVIRTRLPEAVEVLVIDDRSEDGTPDIAEQILQREALGRVLRREGPRDLTQAILTGCQSASGDLIAVMDADLSHPPELLPALVEAVRSGHDVAVASRYVPGGSVANWAWRRRVLSWMGCVMARPLVGIADATSGYFVCKAPVFKALSVRSHGFKILLEMLVQGGAQRVCEIPYTFVDRKRGSSKLNRRVLWLYVLQLGQLYLRRCARRTHA